MGHLHKAQREELMNKALEIVKVQPGISMKGLSEAIGLSASMCGKWYDDNVDGFKELYHEALRAAFNSLEGVAIKTMADLLEEKNFQASKYVLDNRGYKAADKIEAKVDATAQVVFVDDLEEGSNE